VPQPPSLPARPAGPPRPSSSLHFAPARGAQSVRLDGERYEVDGQQIEVPFVYWPDFLALLDRIWTPGPPDWDNANMAIVGKAGSGKSTLTREISDLRERTVLFGSKMNDDPLYKPLLERGYVIRERWTPENTQEPKVIFRPPLSGPSKEALAEQREAFRQALIRLWQIGGWEVWLDEVRYLTEQLNLTTELNLLWLQGRSAGVTMVSLTQRPVSVPLNMFEQSRFLITARITGREDRRTMSDYAGASRDIVFELASRLEPREFLFVDNELDILCRTRVELTNSRRPDAQQRSPAAAA
jgi:hypothetical protein